MTYFVCNTSDGSSDDECVTDTTACDTTDSLCTDPDTCDPTGTTCQPNNTACASVTSSTLCQFDVLPDKGACLGGNFDRIACSFSNACGNDPTCVNDTDCAADGGTCEPTSEFRLIYPPEVQNWIAYKLNASNPGQFFYNLIYEGASVTTVPSLFNTYRFINLLAATVG